MYYMRLVLKKPKMRILQHIEDGLVSLDDNGEAVLDYPGLRKPVIVTAVVDEFEEFHLVHASIQSRTYKLTPRGEEVMTEARRVAQ